MKIANNKMNSTISNTLAVQYDKYKKMTILMKKKNKMVCAKNLFSQRINHHKKII